MPAAVFVNGSMIYMKKGQEYIGIVKNVNYPNKGEVECEDGTVCVKGVLPGEKIRFVISKKRSGKFTGRLLEVLEPSLTEDVSPKCPHFGKCGGCSYQTLSYKNQLRLKSEMVEKLLNSVTDMPFTYESIKESPHCFSYRNKMEFTFGDEYKDGPLSLGMHCKNSFYDVVTTDNCQIVHEDYQKVLKCVLSYCADKGLPYYHRMKHEGYLRHLLVRRTDTGQMLVAIVTTSDKAMEEQADFSALPGKLTKLDLDAQILGVLHIINDKVADIVQSDETRILYGQDYIEEDILGMKFKISTFSFFQTNSSGAEVLYSKAREYVGNTGGKVVYDLYSGTGTIAQLLAPVAKKVIGVEIVEEAVLAAKDNAKRNRLCNCEFIAGDVLKVIDDLTQKPDIIVLDPPREGLNPLALKKIANFGVERMVYISCKPTSLSRDLLMLKEYGYHLKKACAVDMFPQTEHVETVALIEKQGTKLT